MRPSDDQPEREPGLGRGWRVVMALFVSMQFVSVAALAVTVFFVKGSIDTGSRSSGVPSTPLIGHPNDLISLHADKDKDKDKERKKDKEAMKLLSQMGAPQGPECTTLKRHKGFVPLLTHPKNSQVVLADFTDLVKDGKETKVLVTALYARGTFDDRSGEALTTTLHEPVEDTQDTVLSFKQSQDGQSLDVQQPQMILRTSDKDMREALRLGAWSGSVQSLGRIPCIDLPKDQIVVDVGELIENGFFVAGWGKRDIANWRLLRVRSFPHNIDITVELQLQVPHVGQVAIAVAFSMVALPEVPMAPRLADDRLGFFTVNYMDLGQHKQLREEALNDAVDSEISVIYRFDLQRIKTIKIYVDPSVPHRWRQTFREGIEAWNDAFGPLGFKEGIKAVCPGDPDWPEDYDAGDARYNTISWSVDIFSVHSLGMAKVDPRSGEVLKSDITMTSGWVHAWLDDLDHSTPNMTRTRGSYRHETRLTRPVKEVEADVLSKFEQTGVKLSVADRQKALATGLKSIVMHEVGHCLGLRHNFKGSFGIDWECAQDKACSSEKGLSISVMDYMPMNVPASGDKEYDLFTPVIGSYDKLAIKYGYVNDGQHPKGGAAPHLSPKLLEVLQEAEGLPVCSDEDFEMGDDPECEVHDLTSDPIRWYKDRLQLVGASQQRLLEAAVRPNEPYTKYGNAVLASLEAAEKIAFKIVRWLGGIRTGHRHRQSDGKSGQPPLRPIPMATQRRALTVLLGILRPYHTALFPPDSYLPYLVSQVGDSGVGIVDLQGIMVRIQQNILDRTIDVNQIRRMYSAQTAFSSAGLDEKPLSTGEFLVDFATAICGDDFTKASPHDWDLQAYLIEKLTKLYYSRPGVVPMEVQAYILHLVHTLKKSVDQSLDEPGLKIHDAAKAYLLMIQRQLSSIDGNLYVNPSAPPQGTTMVNSNRWP